MMTKRKNERPTRRAPQMEQFVTVAERSRKKGRKRLFDVHLQVGVQSFKINHDPDGLEKTEAYFFQDMLCIALARLFATESVRLTAALHDEIMIATQAKGPEPTFQVRD